ncbi:hypothetical protein LVJ94_26030 [Pendulispora rubella]|uniref:Uncharacterized protein n=1 Tax=Pendulispora rubella TaxID=2741070 RepID=A0ABZ2LLK8_9BACT
MNRRSVALTLALVGCSQRPSCQAPAPASNDASPHRVHVQDVVVALDYGQFYLRTGYAESEDDLAVLDRAIKGDGIARGKSILIVLSPHQNNFEMPLRIERWPSEPPKDLEQWQEAFEASLTISDFGLYYESPTLQGKVLETPPPGTYAVRITGRGFVAAGWPGSTTPGDQWRIQLWPTKNLAPPKRVLTWSGPGSEHDATTE